MDYLNAYFIQVTTGGHALVSRVPNESKQCGVFLIIYSLILLLFTGGLCYGGESTVLFKVEQSSKYSYFCVR